MPEFEIAARPRTLVFLHGLFGCELLADDRRDPVWPIGLWDLIRDRYPDADQLLRDDLKPGKIINKISGVFPVYGPLIDDFEACGFRTEASSQQRLLIFTYDWRRDLSESAAKLAAELATVPVDHTIDIVAHSLGGLLARYVLEADAHANATWLPQVSRLVTIATPHYGAPRAIYRAAGREKVFGIAPDLFKQMADDPLFPSGYQTIPPRGSFRVLSDDPTTSWAGERDPHTPEFITRHGLSEANMKANQRFHAQLDFRARRKPHIEYYFYGAADQKTANRLQEDGRDLDLNFDKDGGDGLVPANSSVISGIQGEYIHGDHGKMFNRESFFRRLSKVLDISKHGISEEAYESGPAVEATSNQLSLILPSGVINAGSLYPVMLEFETGQSDLDVTLSAVLQPDWDDDPADKRRSSDRADAVESLVYKGPPVRALRAMFKAPETPGLYKFEIGKGYVMTDERSNALIVGRAKP